MTHRVIKTYGHERGLSCCFRQWRAKSHCAQLHGYALSFELTFESERLDDKGWVIDFGNLKWVKELLEKTFDHTLVIASDDPDFNTLYALGDKNSPTGKIADVLVMQAGVGCERFAEYVYHKVSTGLWDFEPREAQDRGLRLVSVKVSEHGSNSALYYGKSV